MLECFYIGKAGLRSLSRRHLGQSFDQTIPFNYLTCAMDHGLLGPVGFPYQLHNLQEEDTKLYRAPTNPRVCGPSWDVVIGRLKTLLY